MSIFDLFKRLAFQVPTCKEAHDFLFDYVDGSLSPSLAKQFELHIRVCPNCATYLNQYRRTVSMLNNTSAPNPPDELVNHTISFLNRTLDQDQAPEV